MAYNETKPTDDEYIAAGPAAIRENFRALKEDQIVNAGKVNGLSVGNASGDIPKANGVLCTNLNAQYLGGNLAGYFSPATHTHSAATTSSNGLMANTDKAKLDSIAAGAQVNQNAFASVLVGGTTIQADAATDTLELVAGSNIVLTPDATNDRITIGITGTVPTAATAAVCTGNAATATTLQTARTIGISGDATGTATSFNGSTNITIPVTLATSGVTAGTYSSVTVDAKGRVTGGSNPATISANTTGNAATATTATTAATAANCTGNSATVGGLAITAITGASGTVVPATLSALWNLKWTEKFILNNPVDSYISPSLPLSRNGKMSQIDFYVLGNPVSATTITVKQNATALSQTISISTAGKATLAFSTAVTGTEDDLFNYSVSGTGLSECVIVCNQKWVNR